MFTGIVEELGEVDGLVPGDPARLRVRCRRVIEDATVGGSVAVDGCCLTITALDDEGFEADLMGPTLETTALGDHAPGDPVNLEPPVAAQGRLGGHLVQGHVDGVGEVVERRAAEESTILVVTAPPGVVGYLVPRGSVTVQGVSLTVIDVTPGRAGATGSFSVGLIPHTLEVTTLGRVAVGDRVNLEADVIAKYVERLLAAGAPTPYRDD